MGAISVMTSLKVPGEIVYDMLKSRTNIEQSYDTFKNTIHADRTYMLNDQQMQGWTFVDFITLVSTTGYMVSCIAEISSGNIL
ncbi:MAG: hypothetical protein QXU98_02000 [Candidatus Parvarchaeota archaeon]